MAENERLPRFYKVFLSVTTSDSLEIPLSYMEHLADPLPNTAKLQGTGGRDWTVTLTKIRDAVYFTDGWSKFVKDHELVDGEYLTFCYDGNRTFEVSVYGHSGCKETRAVAEILEVSDSEEVVELSTDTEVDDNDDTSYNPFDDEETESNAAGNLHVESRFTTTLKNRNFELLIPANVVKQNNLTFGDSLKYIDGGEETIIGKRAKFTDGSVRFKGWGRICRRHRLKKNQDIVECELLHDQKKVHSIRIRVLHGTT